MKKLFLFAVVACLISCNSANDKKENVGAGYSTMEEGKNSLNAHEKLEKRGINTRDMRGIKILKECWVNDSVQGTLNIIQYQYTTKSGNDTVTIDTIP